MKILTGKPKEIFNLIYKRYNSDNLINSDEIRNLFHNINELEEDLSFLHSLDLIDHDYHWNYVLTSKGRTYYKDLFLQYFFATTKSIFCPIIVAFVTTLITLWLKGSL